MLTTLVNAGSGHHCRSAFSTTVLQPRRAPAISLVPSCKHTDKPVESACFSTRGRTRRDLEDQPALVEPWPHVDSCAHIPRVAKMLRLEHLYRYARRVTFMPQCPSVPRVMVLAVLPPLISCGSLVSCVFSRSLGRGPALMIPSVLSQYLGPRRQQ